jgi:hypothetical protein
VTSRPRSQYERELHERAEAWFAAHRATTVRRPHGQRGYVPVRLERARSYDPVPGPVCVVRRVGDDQPLRLYANDFLTMTPARVTSTCYPVCVASEGVAP